MDVQVDSARAWRWIRRLVAAAMLLTCVVVAILIYGPAIQVKLWASDLDATDPVVRQKALTRIANDPHPSVAAQVRTVIEQDGDPSVVEAAAYAAAKIGDPEAVEPILARAEQTPDGPGLAKLIAYAARASQRDLALRDRLISGLTPREPWRMVGSAMGLLELGRPEGVSLFVEQRDALPAEARSFALKEFMRFARPMAEAVGGDTAHWTAGPSDRDRVAPAPVDEAIQWQELALFWRSRVDPRLLNDILDRLYVRDWRWAEVKRLLHARDKIDRIIH